MNSTSVTSRCSVHGARAPGIRSAMVTLSVLLLLMSNTALAQTPFVKAGSVDIAQTHLLNADGVLGPDGGAQPSLVGGRDVLLKVNFVSDSPATAVQQVVAKVLIGNSYIADNNLGEQEIALQTPTGLSVLPVGFDSRPVSVVHTLENSYHATIPASLVRRGFYWTLVWDVLDASGGLVAQHAMSRSLLDVSPPNKMIMNIVNIDWFEASSADSLFTPEFKHEIKQRLPVSELQLREAPFAVFSKVAMPYKNSSRPAGIAHSATELTQGWGDVDVARSIRWASILQKANGINYYEHANFCVINRGDNVGGGVGADGFNCSAEADPGIFWHEFGHTFQLAHWGETGPRAILYPYREDPAYLGLRSTKGFNSSHVGPYWGYEAQGPGTTAGFIPPWLDEDNDGAADRWKRSPMQGGGQVDTPGGRLAHFSDYSIKKIMNVLDDRSFWFEQDNDWIDDAIWAANGPGWYWSSSQHSYSPYEGNGINRPTDKDHEVYSVMVAGNMAATNQFGLAYPPIGPYTANRKTTFDPGDPAAMATLSGLGLCPDAGCDLSVRITQGGAVRTYVLEQSWNEAVPSSNGNAFFEKALNVSAADGSITKIELLHTPDAQTYATSADFTASLEVLTQWPYID